MVSAANPAANIARSEASEEASEPTSPISSPIASPGSPAPGSQPRLRNPRSAAASRNRVTFAAACAATVAARAARASRATDGWSGFASAHAVASARAASAAAAGVNAPDGHGNSAPGWSSANVPADPIADAAVPDAHADNSKCVAQHRRNHDVSGDDASGLAPGPGRPEPRPPREPNSAVRPRAFDATLRTLLRELIERVRRAPFTQT